MPNQQLLEYIKEQSKAGIAADVIKSTLLSAGWSEMEVSEAMRPPASPAAPAMPSATAASEPFRPKDPLPAEPRRTVITTDVLQPKGDPLFDPVKDMQATGKPLNLKDIKSFDAKSAPATSTISTESGFPKKFMAISAILLLLAGGAGVFAYMQFSKAGDLTAQISALGSEKDSLNNQVTNLNSNVNGLSADIQALRSENADLASQLALFAIPSGAPVATPLDITFKGTLAQGRNFYSVTNDKGVVVYIKNYSAIGKLAELVKTEITITGTHLPGSRDITVTAVNGETIAAP